MVANEQPGADATAAKLRTWLLAQDWPRLATHFRHSTPSTAQEHEARALTALATRPGAEGARLAVPDLQAACALQPGNALLAANLVQALLDAGRCDEACTVASAAVQRLPRAAPLLQKLAFAWAAVGRWDEADAACRQALALAPLPAAAPAPVPAVAGEPGPQGATQALLALSRELASRWWQPLTLGGLSLRLPTSADLGFVEHCFADAGFMSRFHRFMAGTPQAAQQFVARATQRPALSRRLEWLVCGRDGHPIGLAGLVDIELSSRRAELLVGLARPDPGASLALKASLLAMHFGFERLALHKLVSHVYADNPVAQHNTLHLGFVQEGFLREHLHTDEGPVGLFVNGLLRTEFQADARLQRLLRRWAA